LQGWLYFYFAFLVIPTSAQDTVNIVQIEPISGTMKTMGDLNVFLSALFGWILAF